MAEHMISARAGRWHPWMWAVIGALLILPIGAMQFTREVNWGSEDLLFAALLLGGGGALYELVARLSSGTRGRLIGGAAILFVVLLIWAEAAVGVF